MLGEGWDENDAMMIVFILVFMRFGVCVFKLYPGQAPETKRSAHRVEDWEPKKKKAWAIP